MTARPAASRIFLATSPADKYWMCLYMPPMITPECTAAIPKGSPK